MTSSFLPDINVWVALHHEVHLHHPSAVAWFHTLDSNVMLAFCRHTQIGIFRLLTTEAVMGGETLTQKQCWEIYSRWIDGGRAVLLADPAGIDREFRACTSADQPQPKAWADGYLAAFAIAAGIQLVTFDQALAARVEGAVLLQ